MKTPIPKLDPNLPWAFYGRVSTPEQATQGTSPSKQLEACAAWAKANSKNIPGIETAIANGTVRRSEFILFDQQTGTNDDRPDFQRAKKLAREGKIGGLILYCVDRAARNVADAIALRKELKKLGVQLQFATQTFDDSPGGNMMFTIFNAYAEYEAAIIRERTVNGRLRKLKDGLLDHGGAPDGYRYIDKRQQDGCRLEVDPVRAEIWQRIFRWRGVEHKAFHWMAKQLNEEGIPSARGGPWNPGVLLQSIKNTTYIGEHRRAGITVSCPAIIERPLFDACQQFKEESRRKHVGRPSNKYLLRGFIWCSKPGCGHRMTTNPGCGGHKPKSPRPYYHCGHIERTPYTRLCHAPIVYQNIIEPAAWQEIWHLLTDPEFLRASAENYCEAKQNIQTRDTTAIEQERSQLEAKIKTTRRMMQDQVMPYDDGWTDIRACQARLAQIDQDLRTDGLEVLQLPSKHQLEALLRKINEGPEPGADCETAEEAYAERRPILEKFRDLRMWYHAGLLEIEGKLPLPGKSMTCSGGPVEKNPHKALDPYQNSFPQTVTYFPFRISKRVA